MPGALLTPLVFGDEIKPELRKRRSPDIFQTLTASKPALLEEKVKLEVADGWRIAKKNKNSYRMAQEKPSAELLEDELWCMMAQMGFKELSLGRQFHISVGKDLPPRQIDVFGKDDETAVLIECTQSKEPKSKPMMPLIEKLMAIREGVHNSITAHYGRDSSLKFKLVIATRNIIWSGTDKIKCADAEIAILSDDEIDYYKELLIVFNLASRYQLLAQLFGGTGIGGLARKVVATRGKMGGVKFYNFLIRPEDLLKIAYIGHKSSRNIDNIDTYQRMLKTNRLKNIAKYIEGGGKFPTNIVINIKTSRKKGLLFEKSERVGNEAFGILHLPANYATAWIIDGQHRLYGYAFASMKDGARDDNSTVPVLAFENLPADQEMNMFIDINSKQVKVQSALLNELYADLHLGSSDPDKSHVALLSRIGARLNSAKASPLCDRVIITGKKKTHYRCLTLPSLTDGLGASRLLGWIRTGNFVVGPLSGPDSEKIEKSLDKAVSVLSQCLLQFSNAIPNHWKLGDAPGGYLCTNIAIRAIFLLIKDICDHVAKDTGSDLSQFTADELVEDIIPYLNPVIEYFKNASPPQIFSFRRVGSSLGGVKQQSQGMGVFVRKEFPEFNPRGLQEYIDSRDEAGTADAAVLINKIGKKIFDYVIATLKREYGDVKDVWWTKGIPVEVRRKSGLLWEENNREMPEESYLYLVDYKNIAHFNWDLMKGAFSLGAENEQNWKECLKWVKKLADIRTITHHPEKGVLTVDQVAYVREIAEKVERHFVG